MRVLERHTGPYSPYRDVPTIWVHFSHNKMCGNEYVLESLHMDVTEFFRNRHKMIKDRRKSYGFNRILQKPSKFVKKRDKSVSLSLFFSHHSSKQVKSFELLSI